MQHSTCPRWLRSTLQAVRLAGGRQGVLHGRAPQSFRQRALLLQSCLRRSAGSHSKVSLCMDGPRLCCMFHLSKGWCISLRSGACVCWALAIQPCVASDALYLTWQTCKASPSSVCVFGIYMGPARRGPEQQGGCHAPPGVGAVCGLLRDL